MIPQIITQTAPDFFLLPTRIKKAVQFLKDFNSTWEHRFYNDNEMEVTVKDFGFDIKRLNPEYKICLADIFRYIAMYNTGGVYFDIKSSCTLPLSDVTKGKSLVLAKWPTYKQDGVTKGCYMPPVYAEKNVEFEVLQWFLAAEPKHELFLKTLERVQRNIYEYPKGFYNKTGKFAVLEMTGPVPFTLAAQELGLLEEARDYKYFGLKYSVYNNFRSHRTMGWQHYSLLSSPLVAETNQ